MNQLTPAVKNLLIINVVVFIILQLPFGSQLQTFFVLFKSNLIFSRPVDLFQPIQVVTYFFNHGGIMHIFFNMFMLASLGPAVEMALGSKRFIKFYLFCGLIGGILITLFDPADNPVVGASVALTGMLVAFAMYYPTARLGLFLLPITFKASQLTIGVAVFSLVMVVAEVVGYNIGGNVSHFGHLAGMGAGVLFFYLEKTIPGFRNWPPGL